MVTIDKNIKAIIFDVDGLLIDSEPSWKKSHDEFFERYNLSLNEEERQSFRGIGLKELIMQLQERYQLEKSVEELLTEYREVFYKHFLESGNSALLLGVEGCIKAFYDKGYQLAIATGGHTYETLEQMFKSYNLLHFFQEVVSSDEVHRGKPHPDVFLHTAEKLSRTPVECLVIEDSVNGIKAGKAAGMYVIGVNSDEKLYNQLKEHGADEVFHNLFELHL